MSELQSCPNCDATVDLEHRSTCDRCHADLVTGQGGRPVFTGEAREAGVDLGGLLRLLVTTSSVVPYVGVCPAGAFGLDNNGRVTWKQDWGWLSSGEWTNDKLFFNGREADILTGEIVAPMGVKQ